MLYYYNIILYYVLIINCRTQNNGLLNSAVNMWPLRAFFQYINYILTGARKSLNVYLLYLKENIINIYVTRHGGVRILYSYTIGTYGIPIKYHFTKITSVKYRKIKISLVYLTVVKLAQWGKHFEQHIDGGLNLKSMINNFFNKTILSESSVYIT